MTPNDYQQAALRTEFTPDILTVNRGNLAKLAREMTERSWTTEELATAATKDMQLARILHAMIGMCTESAELQDMIKKHLIYGKAFDIANVVEECGDQLWYIALALDAAGVTMEDAMQRNITKLRLRYPDKFTNEHALNRDLAAERVAIEGSSDVADNNPIRR